MKKWIKSLSAGLLALCLCAQLADAARLTLKDGTVIEGTILESGDRYWVRNEQGSQFIPKSDVASFEKDAGSAGRPADGAASGDKGPATDADFRHARSRAEAVETPIAAVAIWQAFIDNATDETLIESAKTEMAKWQELVDGQAEKIKGKWVGGEEREKIIQQADALNREAFELIARKQTMNALTKLEESARIYPNSFKNNFLLGYVALLQDQHDRSITYFTQALRLKPNSAAAHSNLGVAYAFKRQFEKAIMSMHKAVLIEDEPDLAHNLLVMLEVSPPGIVRSPRLKEVRSTALLLARTHPNIGNSNSFNIVPMKEEIANADDAALSGMVSSGTGFLINSEGLIITNAHVVDDGKTFMVMLNSKDQRSAEVLHVDEAMDLAVIRIKPKEGEALPFLQLAPTDRPNGGADCTVMGYPMIDRLGGAIKITRGIVTSADTTITAGADVLIDAKVNPGNSGGPILDRYGHVMAVVCMKSFTTATEDSYGIGISAGNVRKFLSNNNITIEPAAASTDALNTEQIAQQATSATVCIIATR